MLARVRHETGVNLHALTGADEARLTFLAVRRWFGWSAGRLLALDIGGGSLEIAAGYDEQPELAQSLPLGAGRLTRERFSADPPPAGEVAALTSYVDGVLADVPDMSCDRAAATSKTFRTLARLAGAAPSAAGFRAPRSLTRTGLHQVLGFIKHMSSSALAEMDGVSAARAHQLLAGAVVAEATMRHLGVQEVDICPWALREGVILRRLDAISSL
jgi:exopolyphosphatase/guanosine-5'-triphosphate,3'-diphosphate pyrophosphatase